MLDPVPQTRQRHRGLVAAVELVGVAPTRQAAPAGRGTHASNGVYTASAVDTPVLLGPCCDTRRRFSRGAGGEHRYLGYLRCRTERSAAVRGGPAPGSRSQRWLLDCHTLW